MAETLATLISNGSNINARVKNIIRRAVTESRKRHLDPVIARYITRVSRRFRALSAEDVEIDADFEVADVHKELSSGSVGSVAYGVIDTIAATNPILKAIVVGLSLLVNTFLNLFKREEAKEKIRAKLNGEFIPQIIDQLGEDLERGIANQIDQIDAEMEKQLDERRAAIEKAMADLKRKINEEAEEKERYAARLERSLKEISALRETLAHA